MEQPAVQSQGNEQLLVELRRTIAMLQQRQEDLESEVTRRKLAEARLSQREQSLVERTEELVRANQQLSVEVERRKHSEEKLKQIRHTLTEAQRIGHVGSWTLDVKTGAMEWSDELFRICGLEPQSVTPTMEWMLAITTHPEDREAYKQAIARLMAGERHFEIARRAEWALPGASVPADREASRNILLRIVAKDNSFEIERRFMRPDGAVRYGIARAELIVDDSGALIRMVGSVADITEMKESEQKLQESEERFRSLVDMSSDWYWEQDAQMRFTKVFAYRTRYSGDDPQALLGLSPWDIPSECDDATRLAFHAALEARQPYHELESWITYPDSPPRYFVSSGKPMFDASGRFIGYRGLTREVTERMRTLEALQRFRAAMDSTADAIFLVCHASLTFIDANATACRMLGYTREELLQLSAADLGSLSLQQLRALSNDLVEGKDRGIETVWMRHKNGSRLSVEMRRHALRSGQDWIIVVVAHDITQRRITEAALRQSQEELRQLAAHQEHIKEEERKRIAREIHDELGGVLTGIKANISVSIDRAAGAGLALDPLLVDSAQLADAAIGTVRRVISDLRPSVLDQLGVWAALEWYARQTQERTGLQCACSISNSAAITELDPERSTMVFRVVQEALTNVVRHAEATHVAISVRREEDAIAVEIKDDGKGMDAQRLLDGGSWGILGMHERARHFNASIKFNGAPGKGTAVLLHLPLKNINVG